MDMFVSKTVLDTQRIGIAFSFALSIFCAHSKGQEKPSEATRVEQLVTEWTTGHPDPKRARAILAELRALPTERTEQAMSKAIKSGPNSRSIDLIGQLAHPRAWHLLQNLAQDETWGARAIHALLKCNDEDTERSVCQKWDRLPPDGHTFRVWSEALQTHRLYTKQIEFFAKQGKGAGTKADTARRIAAKSLGTTLDANSDDIANALRSYMKAQQLLGTPHPVPADAIALRTSTGIKWDSNRELPSETQIHIPTPEWAGTEDHILVIRFAPLSDNDVEIGYESGEGLWSIKMREGKGVIVAGSMEEYPTDVTPSTWNTFSFQVQVDDEEGVVQKSRTIAMKVNDRRIQGYFSLNGDLTGIYVRGHCAVGGCYIERWSRDR
jgi:hypothetical protein